MIPNDFVSDLFHESVRTSIVIGENGSGKSRLLNAIAKQYLSSGFQVIGITNSIHDQYTIRNPNFHFLGARSGRNMSKNTIKNAIENISNQDMVGLKNISKIISYVGYSGEIGFKVKGLRRLDDYILEVSENLSQEEKDDINSLISTLTNTKESNIDFPEYIRWLDFDVFAFQNVSNAILFRLIRLEPKLKKLGALKSVDILFKKNGREIPLNKASSGELSFITSMIYLSTIISDKAIVLIDEPENSLHPAWQKEYLGKLLDLFPYYKAKIIIATHSPLIVSGARNTDEEIKIYKLEPGHVSPLNHEPSNFESLLWSMFGVITPESRHLSNYFVNKLNDLSENRITIDEVMRKIDSFEESSYNDKQIATISGVRDLALKIEERKAKERNE
jgi:predicted ATP-binding protein involved in virulence